MPDADNVIMYKYCLPKGLRLGTVQILNPNCLDIGKFRYYNNALQGTSIVFYKKGHKESAKQNVVSVRLVL